MFEAMLHVAGPNSGSPQYSGMIRLESLLGSRYPTRLGISQAPCKEPTSMSFLLCVSKCSQQKISDLVRHAKLDIGNKISASKSRKKSPESSTKIQAANGSQEIPIVDGTVTLTRRCG
jgi:hypothetical protein